MVTRPTTDDKIIAIFDMLTLIPDPEIPVVNIVDMGMVRHIDINDTGGCTITITPTYSGCPAISMITADVKATLEHNHIAPVTVKMVYDPAWTTDWMTDTAKEKLRAYGIAPPLHSSCSTDTLTNNTIPCPHCGSTHTELISRFGATACKALYKCTHCKEPFEYFKCH